MAENSNDPNLSTADMAAAAERREAKTPTTTAQPRQPGMAGDGASVGQASQMPAGGELDQQGRLLDDRFTGELRRRWTDVQVSFVDEPRKAVQQADGLVAEAIKQLAETFAQERARLEQQWDRGGDVSTEELRVALRRYRTFFERLLST
ncbi:MAG TPA: hypothetical protein VKV26_01985 [Dehalococcoidia bacterium]|nr:hypothetical protein [Dehalococcoidia bacterium]